MLNPRIILGNSRRRSQYEMKLASSYYIDVYLKNEVDEGRMSNWDYVKLKYQYKRKSCNPEFESAWPEGSYKSTRTWLKKHKLIHNKQTV